MNLTTNLITNLGTHAVAKNTTVVVVIDILNQQLVDDVLTDVPVDVQANDDDLELQLRDKAGNHAYTAVGTFEATDNPNGSKVRFTIPADGIQWEAQWWQDVTMVGAVRRRVNATGTQDEHGQITLIYSATPGTVVANG